MSAPPVLLLQRSFSLSSLPLRADADERRLTRWRQSLFTEDDDCDEANENRSIEDVRFVTGFLTPDGRTVESEGREVVSNVTGRYETVAGEEVERMDVEDAAEGKVGGTSIGGLKGSSARGCCGMMIVGEGRRVGSTGGGVATRGANIPSSSWSIIGVGGIGSSLGGDGGGGVLDADGYPWPSDICDVRRASVFCADRSDGLEGRGEV